MERSITGYRVDAEGEWVAELECGHDQHVRHRPPFQPREWILNPERRAGRVGTPLSCPLCDRAELPTAVRLVRTSPVWSEQTMPSALRRRHRLAPSSWGVLVVHEGVLGCLVATEPVIDLDVTPGTTQALPPGVEHAVTPKGAVRFSIQFLAVHRSGDPEGWSEPEEEGGDPACWAGLLCPECGAIGGPSGYHRPGCAAAETGTADSGGRCPSALDRGARD